MDFLNWARNQWDRVSAWVLVALGALALILGWVGATGTPYTFEQIPYVISGGLGGIFLLGVGAMLWISADLRDEWRKLDDLVRLQERVREDEDWPEGEGPSDAHDVSPDPSTNGKASKRSPRSTALRATTR